MNEKLGEKLKKAIELRERGELSYSRKIFEGLKEEISERGRGYVQIQAEYVNQLRLEAQAKWREALTEAKKLLKLDRENGWNEPLSVRSLSNTYLDLGRYEAAEPLLTEVVELYPDNSLRRGDAQSHLAYGLLRVNRLKEAESLIEEAIDNIRKNDQKENYLEVREAFALMVRAMIKRAGGNQVGGKRDAEEALRIAKRGKAVWREKQAEELLEVFK